MFELQQMLSATQYLRNLQTKMPVYKSVMLPIVLYQCETRSLTFRKQYKLRVFENKSWEYLDLKK
jgi:hypothetical protein